MTKLPRRTKGNQNKNIIHTVTTPGACVPVYHLESPMTGVIAQMKASLTKKRYRAATIFFNHTTRLGYMHLQKGLTSNETLDTKNNFKAYDRKQGVTVRH